MSPVGYTTGQFLVPMAGDRKTALSVILAEQGLFIRLSISFLRCLDKLVVDQDFTVYHSVYR